jgi:hypothetical protein
MQDKIGIKEWISERLKESAFIIGQQINDI